MYSGSGIDEHSPFVMQIVEAMKPLVGVIESSEVRKYGLQEASNIYDRLLPHRTFSNGVPPPNAVTKSLAVAEAFALACKKLDLQRFIDFSEIDFLLSSGFKDTAAIKCGVELETHLRKLCVKYGIDVMIEENRAKKAERLNSDLAAINVYNKHDQKQISSWLELRNNAAHGNFQEFTDEHVSLMIQGVRDFIFRHPI
jgi:hypothetical protein